MINRRKFLPNPSQTRDITVEILIAWNSLQIPLGVRTNTDVFCGVELPDFVPAMSERSHHCVRQSVREPSVARMSLRWAYARSQFSTRNSLTRSNSRWLSVMAVQPRAIAWAAMSRSLPPIGCPAPSSVVRTVP
jgi:hypothetical protein